MYYSSNSRGRRRRRGPPRGAAPPTRQPRPGRILLRNANSLLPKKHDLYRKNSKKIVSPFEMKFEMKRFVQGQDNQGRPVQGQIVKIEEESINLDMNHPLAGEDLNFEIELVEIIK